MEAGDTDALAGRFAAFLAREAPPLRRAELASGGSWDDAGFAACLIFAAGWYAGQDGAELLVPLMLDGALREGAVPERWVPLIETVIADLDLERAALDATSRIASCLDECDGTLLAAAVDALRQVQTRGRGRLPRHGEHVDALLLALWLRWQDGGPQYASLDEIVSVGVAQGSQLSQEGADLCAAASWALARGDSATSAAPDGSEEAYRDTRLEIALALRAARAAVFERTGEAIHLDEIIRLGAVALEFATGDGRAGLLTPHAEALAVRFEGTGVPEDLDAAIKAARLARLGLPPSDVDRMRATEILRVLLGARYRTDPARSDANELIDVGLEILQDPRTVPDQRAAVLRNRVDLCWERCNRELRAEDLERAVEAGRELAALVGDADAANLSTLCFLLNLWSAESQDPEDLRQAVEFGRRAVSIPADRPQEQARRLGNLFNALVRSAEQTSSIPDFDAAIEAACAAVELYPRGSGDRAAHLVASAAARCGRFQLSGAEEDLAAAILDGREAVAAAEDRTQELSCAAVLIAALALRLRHYDDVSALDEALGLARRGWLPEPGWLGSLQSLVGAIRARANDLALDPEILETVLPTLAGALAQASMDMLDAGTKAGDVRTADLALSLLAAAEEVSGTEHAAVYVGARAQIMLRRWQITGRRADLDAAIAGMIEAGEALTTVAPDLAGTHLGDAAIALFRRFRRRRHIADLERSVDLAQRALEFPAAAASEVRAQLEELISGGRRQLVDPPMVLLHSTLGEGDREDLTSLSALAVVDAWNKGLPRASGLSWITAEPGGSQCAESDRANLRVLFLRTFTGGDDHAVLTSVAMALDATGGRIEVVTDLRDRASIERSWARAFGDRALEERIDFVASTREGWRRDVLERISSVDAIVFFISPKDADFPDFRFGQPQTRIDSDEFWNRFVDTPMSRPVTGPGLLREVSYVNRMGRLPVTLVVCDDRHQPTLDDLIALSGVMGDATDVAGNFITPRLTAIDKQVGHLAKAYRGISYRHIEGAPVLPDLAAAIARSLLDLRAEQASVRAPSWRLEDLCGCSPSPRRLPPDNALKIVAFSDVETTLFLPSREVTEVDPREIPILLSREAVATGCPYCRAPLAQVFFFVEGLWKADEAERIQTATMRGICQLCGKRSTRQSDVLMPE